MAPADDETWGGVEKRMAPVLSGMEIFEVQHAGGIVTEREAGCEGGGTNSRVLAAP